MSTAVQLPQSIADNVVEALSNQRAGLQNSQGTLRKVPHAKHTSETQGDERYPYKISSNNNESS